MSVYLEMIANNIFLQIVIMAYIFVLFMMMNREKTGIAIIAIGALIVSVQDVTAGAVLLSSIMAFTLMRA